MSKVIEQLETEFTELIKHVPARHLESVSTAKKRGSYGHDLQAAINAGYRRKAREHCDTAMDFTRKSCYGGLTERSIFGITVGSLMEAAALRGVTAEDIRNVFKRHLESNDSLSIEKQVERALAE